MNSRRDAQEAVLKIVAERLGAMREQVVFVGGIAAGLLITEPGSPDVRPTDDIDMIVECTTNSKYAQIQEEMRSLGFRNVMDGPICRFSLGDILVDIMPTEEHVLGFHNKWYSNAIGTAREKKLTDELKILVIDAPIFLCTKFEAFADRGSGDFQASSDIEDIVTVIDGRQELFLETYQSSAEIKEYLAMRLESLLASEAFVDALPGFVSFRKEIRDKALLKRMQLLVNTAMNTEWNVRHPERVLPEIYKLLIAGTFNERPKAGLTVEQHLALAPTIREMRNHFVEVLVQISRIFPKNCPIQRKLSKSLYAFDVFKSALDDQYSEVEEEISRVSYYDSDKSEDAEEVVFACLDAEINVMFQYLELLEMELKGFYPSKSKPRRELEKLLVALNDLQNELRAGWKPKKSRQFEFESRFSADVRLSSPEKREVRQRTTTTKDLLNHECEHCKPLGWDGKYPVLPAYADPMASRQGTHQLYVWCRYCWCFHLHGGGRDPLNGSGDGFRAPHCWLRDELGSYEFDYKLKCVGFLTREIEDAHKANLRLRSKYVRELREERHKKRSQAFINGDRCVCGLCIENVEDAQNWHRTSLQSKRGAYLARCNSCDSLVDVTWSEKKSLANLD